MAEEGILMDPLENPIETGKRLTAADFNRGNGDGW